MSHEFTIEAPNTCGFLYNPTSSLIGVYVTGTNTVVGCSEEYTELRQFVTKEDCFASLLQLDPTYPKAKIFGSIVIIPNNEPPQHFTTTVGNTVTFDGTCYCPDLPEAVLTYEWFRINEAQESIPIPGANSATYQYTGEALDTNIIFHCKVLATAPDNWVTESTFKYTLTVYP